MRRLWFAIADDLDADPRELAIASAQALIAAPFIFAGLLAFFWLLASTAEALT